MHSTNNIKIQISLILLLVFLSMYSKNYSYAASFTQNKIVLQIGNPYMIVNGVKKEIDPKNLTYPIVDKSGLTMLPIRALTETLGGSVSWDGNSKRLLIRLNSNYVKMWLDKKEIYANNIKKTISVPPRLKNSITLVPLRYIIDNLGCTAIWDGSNKTITIYYPNQNNSEAKTEKLITQVSEIADISVYVGEALDLPSSINVSYSDGSNADLPVKWDNADTSLSGIQTVLGRIDNYPSPITVKITVNEHLPLLNIEGYVSDKDTYESLSDSNITFSNDDWSLSTEIDANGYFNFEEFPAGTYTVSIIANGHTPYSEVLEVHSDEALNFYLNANPN